jgi:hypothetical protein
LDFQNAVVPLDHLIGKENDGFRIVMYNFNHERFYICAMCVRLARVCMEECIKYALKRKTFGKVNYRTRGIPPTPPPPPPPPTIQRSASSRRCTSIKRSV